MFDEKLVEYDGTGDFGGIDEIGDADLYEVKVEASAWLAVVYDEGFDTYLVECIAAAESWVFETFLV